MIPQKRNDTKLLLAVAGAVVTGVAAIALIAGLQVDREVGTEAPRATRAIAPAPPPAMPAMVESTPGPPIAIAEVELPDAVEASAAEFTIDPNADFVAGGMEAWNSRDFVRAVAYFEAQSEVRPQRAWTHYMLGLSLWKAGRTDDAAAAMEEASRLDPQSIRTLVNLSRIHNDRADFEGALDAALGARTLDTTDPSALFLEGRSLFNLGRLDEAVDALTSSVSIDPDNGHAQNLLGLTRIRQGRPDEAIDPLERAALVEPEVAYIRNNLGMALELSGRAAEAVVAYRRGSEIEPGGKAALNLARLEPTVEPLLAAEVAELDVGGEATEGQVTTADETVEVVLAEAPDANE
jgi:tetratricopeptide (TPR) repeat protein